MPKPKYDANTQRQLNEIAQNASIKELVDSHNELNKRVKILEDARVIQRGLNVRFDREMKKPELQDMSEEIIIEEVPDTIWERILDSIKR